MREYAMSTSEKKRRESYYVLEVLLPIVGIVISRVGAIVFLEMFVAERVVILGHAPVVAGDELEPPTFEVVPTSRSEKLAILRRIARLHGESSPAVLPAQVGVHELDHGPSVLAWVHEQPVLASPVAPFDVDVLVDLAVVPALGAPASPVPRLRAAVVVPSLHLEAERDVLFEDAVVPSFNAVAQTSRHGIQVASPEADQTVLAIVRNEKTAGQT